MSSPVLMGELIPMYIFIYSLKYIKWVLEQVLDILWALSNKFRTCEGNT